MVGESGQSRAETEFGIELDATVLLLEQLGQAPLAPLEVTRVGNGQSNVTLLLTDQRGHRWVLRRPPLGARLDSAHDMVREHRVLAALRVTSVPAPKVFGLGKGPGGVELLLMQWVDGLVIDGAAAAERLPSPTRHAVGLFDGRDARATPRDRSRRGRPWRPGESPTIRGAPDQPLDASVGGVTHAQLRWLSSSRDVSARRSRTSPRCESCMGTSALAM